VLEEVAGNKSKLGEVRRMKANGRRLKIRRWKMMRGMTLMMTIKTQRSRRCISVH
jgi:hypothetical protein